MKKLLVTSIIVLITVIASILYAAHTLILQEDIVYLEQVYMSQYPAMPSIVID